GHRDRATSQPDQLHALPEGAKISLLPTMYSSTCPPEVQGPQLVQLTERHQGPAPRGIAKHDGRSDSECLESGPGLDEHQVVLSDHPLGLRAWSPDAQSDDAEVHLRVCGGRSYCGEV